MKKRIYTIAKETKRSNQEILEVAQSLGFDVSSVSNSLTEAEELEVLSSFRPKKAKPKKPSVKVAREKVSAQKKAKPKTVPVSTVKTFTESYEKKPKKKEAPSKVKSISPQKANRLFVFGLLVFTGILLALGGIGIASDLRMNQLVKDTNRAIQMLNQDNQKQNQAIERLEQGVKK